MRRPYRLGLIECYPVLQGAALKAVSLNLSQEFPQWIQAVQSIEKRLQAIIGEAT